MGYAFVAVAFSATLSTIETFSQSSYAFGKGTEAAAETVAAAVVPFPGKNLPAAFCTFPYVRWSMVA